MPTCQGAVIGAPWAAPEEAEGAKLAGRSIPAGCCRSAAEAMMPRASRNEAPVHESTRRQGHDLSHTPEHRPKQENIRVCELLHIQGASSPLVSFSHQDGVTNFKPGDTTMFTKTLITVALIVAAISSSASAATVKKPQASNAGPAIHGTWDPYGLRFDDGTE